MPNNINDILKGNAPIYTLLALVLSGGGVNLLSEGAEEAERASETQSRQEADYIQDTKHSALLALVNEMRIEMAVLQEKMQREGGL